ncbi:hypothetical protein PM082_023015, partial [Marasmius tenuissimus]
GIDRYIMRSFEEWLKSYTRAHADALMTRRDEFMTFIQREADIHPQGIPEDRKPILEGRKQPALYIDFNQAAIPNPDDPIHVQFVDRTLLSTRVAPHCPEIDGLLSAMKHWDDSAVDENKLFVLGLFPNSRIRSYRMFDVMEFPPGAGKLEVEGFYRSIQHDGVKDRDVQELLEHLKARYRGRAKAGVPQGS